jgi:hypothetical protein
MKERTNHDGPDREQSIIDPPGFVYAASLESNLQATAAHAEPHGVHVNVVGQRSSLFCLCNRGGFPLYICVSRPSFKRNTVR